MRVTVPENKEIFSGYFPCNAAPCRIWAELEPKICIFMSLLCSSNVHVLVGLDRKCLRRSLFSKVDTHILFVSPQIANPQILSHSAVANPQISEVCQSANYKSANLKWSIRRSQIRKFSWCPSPQITNSQISLVSQSANRKSANLQGRKQCFWSRSALVCL